MYMHPRTSVCLNLKGEGTLIQKVHIFDRVKAVRLTVKLRGKQNNIESKYFPSKCTTMYGNIVSKPYS